ncbi:class I SAM-dependent methyltransferase [Actinoplanes sp. NPDC051470]|uniref:class I SAM-dependent methyltransferase n=1 Tax=Actinoplanes sp. NPDC051470 TaxID=3157224 RepID=UPI003422FBDF
MASDIWAGGDAYEAYVGRWSRVVAAEFVRGLAGERWLDVGCGTGALSAAVSDGWVVGADRSEAFVRRNPRRTVVSDGIALPFRNGTFDVVISGLALNFMPDPVQGVREMARVADGVVAAYVWDYAEGMQLMRHFWDAVDDPGQDEAARFPICHPDALAEAWRAAGLEDVTTGRIEIPTVFADFDDYWRPFLGGAGAAPGYLLSLPPEKQTELRERVRSGLPEGEIRLTARAWTVRGRKKV